MKTYRRAAAVLFLGLGTSVSASDRTGVYARVDKVVFEPSAAAPQTVQVWGVFSIAEPTNKDDYRPPARGYLYLKLPDDRAAALAAVREWTDLKSVAGTGQVVSFGTRRETRVRVRGANDRPSNPDRYTVNVGVNRIPTNTDYPPVRGLLETQ
jgi:hypothetical protein